MPIISLFYGIIIRLYLIDNQHYNLPHLHAKNNRRQITIFCRKISPIIS